MFFSPIDRWILIYFYGYVWKPCFMKKWLAEKDHLRMQTNKKRPVRQVF